MSIELTCPVCTFSTEAISGAAQSELSAISEDNAWFALGDGETFEDSLYGRLGADVDVVCPHCGAQMEVNEESLGRVAMEMLAQW